MSHEKKTDRKGSLCQCLVSSQEHLLNYCIDNANNVTDFESSFPQHPRPQDGGPVMWTKWLSEGELEKAVGSTATNSRNMTYLGLEHTELKSMSVFYTLKNIQER